MYILDICCPPIQRLHVYAYLKELSSNFFRTFTSTHCLSIEIHEEKQKGKFESNVIRLKW